MVRCGSRTDSGRTAELKLHLKQALAGTTEGSRLAKNLVSHAQLLQMNGNSLGELRAQLESKN
jgi:sRNA-binding protein